MKRSIITSILSIIGSCVPSITQAANVSHTPNVSLVMDTTNMKGWRGDVQINKAKTAKTNKVVAPKVKVAKKIAPVAKKAAPEIKITETKEIKQTLAEFKVLKKASLPNMVKAWGYNWKTDRAQLAKQVGITNYVGTMKQNSLIKDFLLSKIKISDRKIAKEVPTLPKTSKQTKDMDQQPIFVYAKNWGYIREVDKTILAKEAGIADYVGDRDQNLLIKKYLKSKIIEKQ